MVSLPDATTSILLEVPVNSGEMIYICYPFPKWLPPWYKKVNILGKALIFYVVPLMVIATFYLLMAKSLLAASQDMPGEQRGVVKQLQTRKKVAKIVLCFVCIFALCFLPNNIFLMWFYFDPNSQQNYNAFWHYMRPVGFTLSFFNSCVNPLALYFISGQFRKCYNQYLCSHICCCDYFQETDDPNQVSLVSTAGRCQFQSSIGMTRRPTVETVVMTSINHDKNGRTSF